MGHGSTAGDFREVVRSQRPHLLLTRPFLSGQGPRLWGRSVGVPSLFRRWKSLSVIPVSAGDDLQVSLADVRNISYAEA